MCVDLLPAQIAESAGSLAAPHDAESIDLEGLREAKSKAKGKDGKEGEEAAAASDPIDSSEEKKAPNEPPREVPKPRLRRSASLAAPSLLYRRVCTLRHLMARNLAVRKYAREMRRTGPGGGQATPPHTRAEPSKYPPLPSPTHARFSR